MEVGAFVAVAVALAGTVEVAGVAVVAVMGQPL